VEAHQGLEGEGNTAEEEIGAAALRRRAALRWRRVKRWGEGVGARESEKRGETEALARFI
jgi:hypothetical protein